MGPTRLTLSKPVIAAVEGYAVAGGIELALWCDLRVAAEDADLRRVLPALRRAAVRLGTVRLPRIVGHGRAMDLILTGRPVRAPEALTMGLANRVVPPGEALAAALELAQELAALPQVCLRIGPHERARAVGPERGGGGRRRGPRGRDVISSGETLAGAARFAGGAGRRGAALD